MPGTSTQSTRQASTTSQRAVVSVTDLRKDYVMDDASPGFLARYFARKKPETLDSACGDKTVHALRGVSLTIQAGESVALMGASGSGKSTLLHLVGGLDQPTSGTIVIEGQNLGDMSDHQRTLFRRRRLGIVFQSYNLLPTLSIVDNVALPAMLGGGPQGAILSRARDLLDQVDLGHRLTHRPQTLSGGEQQRVAIARALMNNPALLLADEPTGNLDTKHAESIWKLLASLVHDSGCAVVAVTHEIDGASFADRVVVLKDGRIIGELESSGADHVQSLATRYRELAH